MSKLFKIDQTTYFTTFSEKKNELHISLTDFTKGYHASMLVSQALDAAKSQNPNMALPDEEILKFIKNPSDTATIIAKFEDESIDFQFKYPIEQFFFKFIWRLKKYNEVEFGQALIIPAFDALIRIQKSINRFTILNRHDPEELERLPVYSPFDIKYLVSNLESLDLLSEFCKTRVKIESLPPLRKNKVATPRKKGQGMKRKISAHDKLMLEIYQKEKMQKKNGIYESSDSSTEEPKSILKTPEKTVVVNSPQTTPTTRRKAKKILKL